MEDIEEYFIFIHGRYGRIFYFYPWKIWKNILFLSMEDMKEYFIFIHGIYGRIFYFLSMEDMGEYILIYSIHGKYGRIYFNLFYP